jgi:hypothetical protein
VQAAITKAQEMNIKVSAAVCDAGGRLMAFNRMDGAIWGSVYGSQGKAVASAAVRPRQRRTAGARREPDHPGHRRRIRRPHDPEHGRRADHQERRGRGRLRRGGGTSQQDEDVAKAGGREAVAAVRSRLISIRPRFRKPEVLLACRFAFPLDSFSARAPARSQGRSLDRMIAAWGAAGRIVSALISKTAARSTIAAPGALRDPQNPV